MNFEQDIPECNIWVNFDKKRIGISYYKESKTLPPCTVWKIIFDSQRASIFLPTASTFAAGIT